ncbi:MAG: hypothetical protein M1828_006478 [Chrysothrix sp. TS-e1954]|nr:MAG: hypothetical protein M1828_006478 [Chrysothrix sp. TS-e1954]
MALKNMFGRKASGEITSPRTESQPSPEFFDEKNPGGSKDVEGSFAPRKGSRIDKAKVGSSLANIHPDNDSEHSVSVGKQLEMEADNAIKYRTCSWPKVFPAPSLAEFAMRHPEVRDVCDIGQMLFWNSRISWYFTAVMFVLNNTFIMGFHVLVGSEYLKTMSDGGGPCTIAFGVIWALLCFVSSLPRTFDTLSKLAAASAVFTFISVLLASIFAGIEDHPAGYNVAKYGEVQILVIPKAGTTFVMGMNAFLNISYTFIGQITLPSFIAEMKEPKDFPKALWSVTIAEILVFSICGSVTYAYTGTNYNVSPAFGALGNVVYEKVSFSFMIPTLIFLGVLYASVSARFVFFNVFSGTRHMGSHTVVGWASWAGILAILWLFAFIIAQVIPFFSDLLSLMSSLFDSFFGFIFWGTAYLRMRQADYGPGWITGRGIRSIAGFVLNVFLILVGFFFLGGGTYVSVQSIVNGYAAGSFGGAFTCASNALKAAPVPA